MNVEKKVTVLSWGSDGPNGGGHFDVRVGEDGSVEIEENDWGGGSTHYWSREKARRVARAILAATDSKPKKRGR